MFRGFPSLNFQMNNEAYSFSGCTFWLDACAGLDTQTNLGAISKWVEKTRGIIFAQTTAGNQPRLILNDANFNNKPSVDFFNANKRLALSGSSIGVNRNQTLAIVFRKQSNAAGTNAHLTALLGSSSGNCFIAEHGTTNVSFTETVGIGGSNNTAVYSDNGIGDANPHIVVLSGANFISDGAAVTPSGSYPWASFEFSYISGEGGSNSNGVIQVAEVVIWNRSCSQAECIEISDGLNDKYAIY